MTTVACSIGLHKMCDGTCNDSDSADDPNLVDCTCPCHGGKP